MQTPNPNWCLATAAMLAAVFAACSSPTGATVPVGDATTTDGAVTDVAVADVSDAGPTDTKAGDVADGGADSSANAACCQKAGVVCGYTPGCANSCGGCPAGTDCKGGKCIAKPVKKKYGEGCGPDGKCRPPANNAAQTEFNEYYDCLDQQCESGRCYLGLCSKFCAMGKDAQLNWNSTPGQDGIEDPGQGSECDGAVAGPAGTELHCVEQAKPPDAAAGKSNAVCMAGTTFKPCKATSDCSASEACAMRYIRGDYVTVCVTRLKNPNGKPNPGYSQFCNADPIKADIAYCDNNHCSTGGYCLAFCKDDKDCVTSPGACKAGKCDQNGAACTSDVDCSAAVCTKNLKYYSNVNKTFDQCRPRDCALDGDCKDGAFFCRNWYNGVDNIDGDPDPEDPTKIILPGWDPGCVRKQPGTAKKGEACDPFTSDSDTSVPVCENPAWCENGQCGGLCKTDADCPSTQKCGIDESPFDLSNPADGNGDVFLPIAGCQPMPGAKGKCASNKDCTDPAAPYCRPWEYAVTGPGEVTGTTVTTYATGGLCIAPEANLANPFATCGVMSGGKLCRSSVCLGTNAGKQAGYCGELCTSSADCPAKLPWNGGTYKSVCRSYFRAWGGTPEPDDDLYLPFCGTAYKDSSGADCEKTKTCDNPKEYCASLAVAFGPDVPVKMEFKCLSAWTASQTPGTKKAGQACNPTPDANAAPECASGYTCKQDAEKGKGYCIAPCNTDADCALAAGATPTDGLMCDTGHMFIVRKDKAKAGIAPFCLKKKACLPCQWDSDCTADYRCTNLGGPYEAANQRCAAPCKEDADCGAGKCVAPIGLGGQPLSGPKVCKVSCQPL